MATYHGITRFRCGACGYLTEDDYTLEVINDWLGACPACDSDAIASAFKCAPSTDTEGS